MATIILLLILSAVILIHEMGHYVALKAFGVPVKEFSIGIGPKIFSFNALNTKWSVRGLLVGGYNMPDTDVMNEKSIWKRVIIALAGPGFNFISVALAGLIISPALAWLFLTDIPVVLWHTLGAIWHFFFGHTEGLSGPVGMIKHNDLATPIKVTLEDHKTIELSLWVKSYLEFVGLSTAVGVFNLLPLPILDGGRVVLLGFEKILGRAKMARAEPVIIGVSAVAFLGWFVTITINDFLR